MSYVLLDINVARAGPCGSPAKVVICMLQGTTVPRMFRVPVKAPWYYTRARKVSCLIPKQILMWLIVEHVFAARALVAVLFSVFRLEHVELALGFRRQLSAHEFLRLEHGSSTCLQSFHRVTPAEWQ